MEILAYVLKVWSVCSFYEYVIHPKRFSWTFLDDLLKASTASNDQFPQGKFSVES